MIASHVFVIASESRNLLFLKWKSACCVRLSRCALIVHDSLPLKQNGEQMQ